MDIGPMLGVWIKDGCDHKRYHLTPRTSATCATQDAKQRTVSRDTMRRPIFTKSSARWKFVSVGSGGRRRQHEATMWRQGSRLAFCAAPLQGDTTEAVERSADIRAQVSRVRFSGAIDSGAMDSGARHRKWRLTRNGGAWYHLPSSGRAPPSVVPPPDKHIKRTARHIERMMAVWGRMPPRVPLLRDT